MPRWVIALGRGTFVLLLVVLAIGGTLSLWDAGDIGSTPEDWAAALANESETVRDRARDRLLGAGIAALPSLEATAEHATSHVKRRAVDLLEALYLHDEAAADGVERALERLESSESRETRGLATGCRLRLRDQRLERMIARVRELGAGVRTEQISERTGADGVRRQTKNALTVVLGPDWIGGAEGLWLLERMPKLYAVHVRWDAPITDAEISALKKARPPLRILRRGAGCMGMVGYERSGGFEVAEVDPFSGAARADLRPGDLVTHLHGTAFTGYQSLFEATRDGQPGDVVRIRILRNGAATELDIELGSDGPEGDCRCDSPPTVEQASSPT